MDARGNSHARAQGLMAFVERYREFKSQQENTDELIKDLVNYAESVEAKFIKENSDLRRQLGDTHLDLESSKKIQRELKIMVEDLEARLGYVPARNPYVVALIDGNSLVFKEQLVKQGVDGGRKVAAELRKSIVELFGYPKETTVEILAKVVANVPGLSKAMKSDGCVSSETALYEFISGFNKAKAPFDFVDMGHGKEGAEAKILDCARFHLRNLNCKQVVLGISHDSDYASLFSEILYEENTKKRITILEGFSSVQEIQEIIDTGIRTARFGNIFRTEKLAVKSRTQSMSLVPSGGSSYAAMAQAGASPPPKITLPMSLKKPNTQAQSTKTFTKLSAKPPALPEWNPGPRGLDPPIKVKPSVLERLKKREDSNKLCNNHFLRGPCTKGNECYFVHDYNPTKEELDVITLFSRVNRCERGQDCKVENCIYGHHCPSIIKGVCMQRRCKFDVDQHPPGTKFTHSDSPCDAR